MSLNLAVFRLWNQSISDVEGEAIALLPLLIKEERITTGDTGDAKEKEVIIEETEIGEMIITEKGAVPGARELISTDTRDNAREIIAAAL